MKKRILKIVGIVVILVIAILVAIPFFLEAKIGDLIKNNVNTNVNATLNFADADLSLISHFPNAELGLDGVVLTNRAPFEGDTLFASKNVRLTMGIGELFKGAGDPIAIRNLEIEGANLHIIVNEDEIANYDIAKESEASATTEPESEGFSFDLQSYEITDSKVAYEDRAAKVFLTVSDIRHRGNGDLSATTSELDTKTEALVTFDFDSTNYLNRNRVSLEALIGIDLKENKYTFLKNEALVNQLPLVFDGFVKVNETNQEIDINFKTPSSDFKNFLAVMPEAYSKNVEEVQTTGNFTVVGSFNGIVDEAHIPKFNIDISSEKASFKYPDLPKSVENVFIDIKIRNTSGIAEDTYVDIDRLSFMIDQDRFDMTAKIKELMGNTKVNAHIDGTMNLANISQAYPVPAELDLKGILTADVTTRFDMASVEKKQYQNTQTTGKVSLRDFEYRSSEILNPVKLQTAAMTFDQKSVQLNELKGSTGSTDFNATGTIDNVLGFMFNDEKVKGNFNLVSNTFALNDFMVEEGVTNSDDNEGNKNGKPVSNEGAIKIPAFLDANINATASTVLYDNLSLENVQGNLRIQDETARLTNMTSSIFNGKLALNGEVSTKNEIPTFAMKLGMQQVEIDQTFKALELFEVLAPIAQILRGQLNCDIVLSGNLTDNLLPDLLTLSGNIIADIMTRDINTESAPLLAALDSKLDFIDLEDLNLKDLKTKLSFDEGLVKVKPFTLNYKDIAINVDGSHTFDRKLNYQATFEVPAKYLGSEINKLITEIGEDDLNELTIPVVANIGGNYSSPSVTTDLTSGVKALTNQLVEIQKQKLLNKGKEKARDLIGDVLSKNKRETDSTSQRDTEKEDVKEVLGGILGAGKKDTIQIKKDSTDAPTSNEEVVKEKAKSILGGLLGGKKKDSTN
ncbi:AsmA-like C-terminal region-containing protein [Pareuzebyella sediminis]|uniref:AsmA-like C-terminal region-containing protein n=1 Tax=Pareuzebyella sediminis TaxID=2607998 RepID=UPI0011ED9367|nr:AsmA-like C-terminal region-containing protein [Pareuzebyella sediminis]